MRSDEIISDYKPNYLKLYESGELEKRVEAALSDLERCRVCPWHCDVNRLMNEKKVCKTGRYARVSSYFPHFGEEDCLRGWNGSGTIFFAWCNLRCVFCFHPDTFISTDQGPIRISELYDMGVNERELNGGAVRFGDGNMRVFTREGATAKVSKLFRHPYKGDLIRVKLFNCPPLLMTPNHKVFAVRKDSPNQVETVSVSDLTNKFYLFVPKRRLAETESVFDVASFLSRRSFSFRKKSFVISSKDLTGLFVQDLTSNELAKAVGYHPAYIRKLRGQWRRGIIRDDSVYEINELIEENGLIRFQTEKRPGIPAQIKMDERLGWLLGIYCAEGHVTSSKARPNSHRLIFSFGHHETELVEKTRRLLHELFGVLSKIVYRRTTITVEIGKASLALVFADLCGRNSHEKHVPDLIFRSSLPLQQAFLKGVQDWDGCDRGNHCAVNTVSPVLAHGLFEVGLRLGIFPSIYLWQPPEKKTIEGREVTQSPLYYIKFPHLNLRTGCRSRWRETDQGYLAPIHKIEYLPYDGSVFNLEVDDPDHSYLASFAAVGNCQNYDISQNEAGNEAKPERLAEMMLELQQMGCHNINFVTPEHIVPQVLEALPFAIRGGLRLPIVYNTSAFDSLESLRHMDGIVDIYMPDFKYWSEEKSKLYLKSPKYPESARAALKEMHQQVGDLVFNDIGLARRGLLVRHLVMPEGLEETREIMRFIAEEISPRTYVNIMGQYYPAGKVNAGNYAELNRRIASSEMSEAFQLARESGLHRFDERRRIYPRQ